MGEDKTHRLVQAEQSLLVLHNEVVGIGVIGGLGFAVHLALHEAGLLALFLVDGKVALMCLVGGDFVQVTEIGLVADFSLELAYYSFILFLKHPGILAVAAIVVVAVVQAVFGHLIDEEQAEHLDALWVEFPLSADVGADGLPDLDPPLEGGHLLVALDLSGVEFQTIQESDRVVPTVNAVGQDHIAVGVLLQTVGQRKEVIPAADFLDHSLGSGCPLDLEAQTGSGSLVLVEVDALQIDITVGSSGAGEGDAQSGDLLHQVLVVGVHGVQAIHHVVLLLVGGGVAQGKERVELFQALLGLLALHALGLIDDQDGIGLCNDINGLAAAEGVQLFVNDPLVLAGVERLHIDDHHIDGAVRSEAVHLGEPVGGVDEEPDLLAILSGKVLLGGLEGLVDALPDSHRRYHDDELAPAVSGVELVHGFDISIGLAGASLHLNGQIDTRPCQRLRRFQTVPALNRLQIFQDILIGQLRHQWMVPEAGIRHVQVSLDIGHITQIQAVGGGAHGLAVEHIADRCSCLRLKGLVFELKFHLIIPQMLQKRHLHFEPVMYIGGRKYNII